MIVYRKDTRTLTLKNCTFAYLFLTVGPDGVGMKRGPLNTILQGQLDSELNSFRENVEAIRISTEELIKDVSLYMHA